MARKPRLRDFSERTAEKFASSGFRAVCAPTSLGLVNWYSDFLQKAALKSVLAGTKGKLVLDIGCGVGRWTFRLANAGGNVIAINFAEGMISEARRRQRYMATSNGQAQFLVAAAQRLPFKDSTFNCVLCVTVRQHIVDDDEVKKSALELVRVVKPGGKTVLLEAAPPRRESTGHGIPGRIEEMVRRVYLYIGFVLWCFQGGPRNEYFDAGGPISTHNRWRRDTR